MFAPTDSLNFLKFSNPITVESITLETYCQKNNVCPDFVHIDVQGAEYKVFSKLGKLKPKFVWAEICEFDRYQTGVTYNDFHKLMSSLGYQKIYQDGPDELFKLETINCTDYTNKKPIARDNKLKFVFKKDHVSAYNIHGVGKTSFYNLLCWLKISDDPYYPDNLPQETFIYEYQQSWLIDPNEYFGGNGFLEMDPCPENVLERIREKTAFLFITMPYESPLQDYRLKYIHEYLKRHNLPKSQVVYLTCCLNGQEIYDTYCQSIGEEALCNLDYMAENLWIHNDQSKKFIGTNYEITNKPKTFLMFNRRWASHPHRTLFLYNIHKMGLLNQFHISFNKNDVDHNQLTYTNAVKNHFLEFYNIEDLDNRSLKELEDKLPLYLDTSDLVSSCLMHDQFDTTKKFYDESFIHIISETYFNTQIIHITEKTYKPILYKQPFIMLGPPNILKHLREIGFKTFEDVWDESYDNTFNHTERFYKILNLCKKIDQLSNEDKISLMEKCATIVEYNFNKLQSFRTDQFVVKDIVEKYNLKN